jgi:antitoxin (DNA-binding transcriptional repressor) of toxin-antitoxin stability system
VTVLDRNRPVARLVPLPHEGARGASDRLARLERQGLIRRGTGGRATGLRARKPARLPGGVLRGLLEERERGW